MFPRFSLAGVLLSVVLACGAGFAADPDSALKIRLHPETGDPILSWKAEKGEKEFFKMDENKRQ